MKPHQKLMAFLIMGLLVLAINRTAQGLNTDPTIRVSVASSGTQANGLSDQAGVTSDGRYVVFASEASNLVAEDTNEESDIFLHDRLTGTTTCISVAPDGTIGNGMSEKPSITPDGRYIVFRSGARNLVAGDTNLNYDIFVYDRQTGVMEFASNGADGSQPTVGPNNPTITDDGRYVAFDSASPNLVANDTNGWDDVFVHDRVNDTTIRVSVNSSSVQGNYFSRDPFIAGDGRYVVFTSYATNLVSNDTNGVLDVFLHDMQGGSTIRISMSGVGPFQGDGPSSNATISADGQYVVFESEANNFLWTDINGHKDVFLRDWQTESTILISAPYAGLQANNGSSNAVISGNEWGLCNFCF